MSYKTYISEALVCGSRAYRTADRSYLLFTREAGMLRALAKSVREERSKQRFGLQEFSLIRVTLVHGREAWRITGVEPIENFYYGADDRMVRQFVRTAIQSLRRLVHGEIPHPELFDDLLFFLRSVERSSLEALQVALVVRMLYKLGYVAPDALLLPICSFDPYTDAISTLESHTTTHIAVCRERIESALEHSQL